MRATLRSISSYDVDDLRSWTPDGAEWSIGLRLIAGPDDGPGDESFDLTLCSPAWLTARTRRDGIVDARHHLIMEPFDWSTLESYLRRRVEACHGATWRDVAMQLGQLGYWEFEDYSP